MTTLGQNSADDTAMMKIIQRCTHCGEETGRGNKFCKNCGLKSARVEMCTENKKVNPNYKCASCGI